MKKQLLILLLFALTFAAYGQSEYYYFVFKVGANHNFNKNPDEASSKLFLKTPDGEMPMSLTSHTNYVAGYNVGFMFNIDSKKDFMGFVIGAELNNFGIENKYLSENSNYWVLKRYRFYVASFPVYLKLSRNVYKNMKYVYFGAQYNMGLKLQSVEQVGWSNERFSGWENKSGLQKSNISYFIGYNFSTFNIQLDYMPGFFNKNYRDGEFTPFEYQLDNNILIKTSFTIPLNRWLTMKNWTAEKVRRVLMFRI